MKIRRATPVMLNWKRLFLGAPATPRETARGRAFFWGGMVTPLLRDHVATMKVGRALPRPFQSSDE
jgi:hypothetical protein